MKRIIYVLLIFLIAIGAYYLGRNSVEYEVGTTFYATIDEKNDNYFMVSGLEVNDINSRGKFTFTLDDNVALEWRHTEITLADLQVGDTISITYIGPVLERSPGGINDVIKIQLLEDEK